MSLPPPALIPDDVAHLRADLTSLGSIAEELGAVATAALDREQRVPALLAARASGSREAIIARLFLLGDRVPTDLVDLALPTLGSDGATRLGLIRPAGADLVRATVDLRPVGTDDTRLWFASDIGERVTGRALSANHVLGVGGASLTLVGITDRRRVNRALDLGTGCGIQASLLWGHAETVTATDLSERALAFARFNAALNGQEWEVRQGSLFEPVAGERFDLIVSNPPFVITPRAAYEAGLPVMEYRDAGDGEITGDHLLTQILGQLRAHLTSGGRAHMLANWEHRRGEDWVERLATAASGLDLWVIEREAMDPAQYVELWLRDGGFRTGERDRSEAVYAAWLEDFQSRGVESIGFGYILAAPTPAERGPARRFEIAEGPASQPVGEHLAIAFDAQRRHADEAAAHPDTEPLAHVSHWRVATPPGTTVEHHFLPGSDDPSVMLLRQGGGLGRTHRLDTALAGLVSVADGELTVGQTAAALSELLDVPTDALTAEVSSAVVELVATGLLERVD
ncbi:MAG: class I SAM-dependent methyltransferase [bacterium]|nr:class I SAM-dependent methyltransferase [bacterium]